MDAAAAALVARPRHFQVIVTENLFGDILSDLGGATIGGLGMCPSANIGERRAYFEPIHGSAPDIAGRSRANPVSQILSAAMMLDHLGEPRAAAMLEAALWEGLRAGPDPVQGRRRGGGWGPDRGDGREAGPAGVVNQLNTLPSTNVQCPSVLSPWLRFCSSALRTSAA